MTLTKEALNGFTGTEQYYSYLMGLKLTDGVKYLAEAGKCFWLLDIIASHQIKHRTKPFQVWKLAKIGSAAIITMREDEDQPEIVRQKVKWTDFPLDSVEVWVIDGVVLLPSEY